MPQPSPHKGEQEKDFISRCMSDDVMKRDYPKLKQRLAVCYTEWRAKHGKAVLPEAISKSIIWEKISPDAQVEAKAEKADQNGGFFGYMAVFNNIDHQDEVVLPGAFTKSLQEHDVFPLMVVHVSHGGTVKDVVGDFHAKEDDFGLYVDASYYDFPLAQETRQKTDGKAVRGLSVGYRTIQSKSGEQEGRAVRYLSELALVEGTIVVAAANELAVITAAKSLESQSLAILKSISASAGAELSEGDKGRIQGVLTEMEEACGFLRSFVEVPRQPEAEGLPSKADIVQMQRRLSLRRVRIQGIISGL